MAAKKRKPGKAAIVAKVRTLALGFPEAWEKPSHGAPTFFVGKKSFAQLLDNHHGDGRFAMWAAAPEGAQEMLIDSDPAQFFRPAYVGHLGWIGVLLDVAPWDAIASVLENAYLVRATKKQGAQLRARTTSD